MEEVIIHVREDTVEEDILEETVGNLIFSRRRFFLQLFNLLFERLFSEVFPNPIVTLFSDEVVEREEDTMFLLDLFGDLRIPVIHRRVGFFWSMRLG